MARANIYYTDQSMVACLQVSHQHLVMLNSSGSRGVSRAANHIRIPKLVSDGLWHEFRVMHLARVKTNLNKKNWMWFRSMCMETGKWCPHTYHVHTSNHVHVHATYVTTFYLFENIRPPYPYRALICIRSTRSGVSSKVP